MEVFERLNALASANDLTDLFMGTAPAQEVHAVLQDLSDALDTLLDPSNTADLTGVVMSTFLDFSLPVLVELLLRRKSHWSQEAIIVSIIMKVSRLLAQPASLDIVRLCEMRNVLLVGGCSSLRFIDPKQLSGIPSNYSSPYSNGTQIGFFAEFGRPSTALLSGKVVTFWPDEWALVLGKSKAVGHFVRCQSGEEGYWVEGEVISFDKATQLYTVRVIKWITGQDDAVSEIGEGVTISCDLHSCPHTWIDLQYQQRLGSNSARLKYSGSDVGKFIRIWWSKYAKFYYGRVIAFDASGTGQHTVVYEDGDSRSYDMVTKEYELIDPPLDLLRGLSTSDVAASKAVADWHRSISSSPESIPNSEVTLLLESEGDSGKPVFALRPLAASAPSLSLHQLDAINVFFSEGGADNLFQSLLESTPAPSCAILLLHLQMVFDLKPHIGAQRFRDLAWDLKEVIPLVLLRYDEHHMKDFSLKEFNDVLITFKDLLSAVSQDTKDSKRTDLQEYFDLIRLSMAQKLLASPKLQKRYMGLSIVKDMVDALMPKLAAFLQRRQLVLKKGAAAPPRTAAQQYSSSGHFQRLGMSVAKFDRWLEHSNIVDLIFGDSLHEDMIAKADSVLAYLAARRLLREQHVTILWQAARGAHEAIVRVIYHLLLVLIPAMEPSLRQFIFSSLSALSSKEYNEQVLRLIKVFTVESLRADKNKAEDAAFLGDGILTDETRASNGAVPVLAMSNRKGQVINAPERQWVGFGLLWQFVLDSSDDPTIEPSLAYLAAQLLVELLQEEFADERETVMQRCVDNIQLGVSVPMSLQMLRKTLSLYPAASKTWFILARQGANKASTIPQQVDKLVKQSRLMEIFFVELERFHSQFGRASVEAPSSSSQAPAAPAAAGSTASVLPSESAASKRQKSKATEATKLKGITERLDFLQFILSKSYFKLTEAQAMIVWQVFGEDSTSDEALDKLCFWLDGLITTEHPQLTTLVQGFIQEIDPFHPDLAQQLSFLSEADGKLLGTHSSGKGSAAPADAVMAVLEENVIKKIFDDCLMRLACSSNDAARALSRPAVASLCMKMFLLVNINSKSIRLDAEGGWQRTGVLHGVPMLWRIALDSENGDVALAAMKLLVELHHRIKAPKGSVESAKSCFLSLCFRHLGLCIRSLSYSESDLDSNTPLSTTPKPILLGGIGGGSGAGAGGAGGGADATSRTDEWFEDTNRIPTSQVLSARMVRYIMLLRMFVHRYYYSPIHCINMKVIAGADEASGVKMMFKSTDTIGQVRARIAAQYKEEVGSVILQSAANAPSERFDKDDMTLQAAKFGLNEKVYVRRRETSPAASGGGDKSQAEFNPLAVPDIIRAQDMEGNLADSLDPLQWLSISTRCDDVGSLFSLPDHPLQSTVQCYYLANGGYSGSAAQESLAADKLALVAEQLASVVKANPHYVDQLIEMLDVYLSAKVSGVEQGMDLAASVWDILQSLPFHPNTYAQLKTLLSEGDGAKLRASLHVSSPYQLLYSLQILESLMSPHVAPGRVQQVPIYGPRNSVDWATKFFHLGGAELVMELMSATIKKTTAFSATSGSGPPSVMAIPMAIGYRSSESFAKMRRSDLQLLTTAMLSRILHYLLALDPLYRIWQCAPVQQIKTVGSVSTSEAVEAMKTEKIPPGVIMSCVDAAALVPDMVANCVTACELLQRNLLSDTAVRAFVEHSLSLTFGLCTARDDGLSIIDRARPVETLFRSIVDQCEGFQELQLAVARRCFEGCATIYVKCADPLLSQEKKPSRMQLHDRLVETVTSLAASRMGLEYIPEERFGNIYSLLAAVECVRIAPEKAFKGLMLFREARMSMCAQITAMFGTVSADASENAPYVEEQPCRVGKSRELIQIFVGRLVSHVSCESFHSGIVDEALIGILRILVVLALQENTKDYMGGMPGACEGENFVDFLYLCCLFPIVSGPSSKRVGMEAPLCQTEQSRELAYALLYTLCEHCEQNFARLLAAAMQSRPLPSRSCSLEDVVELDEAMSGDAVVTHAKRGDSEREHVSHRKHLWQWDYDPGALVRPVGDFIGLCNQGGTCYMNSFLQQLFHVPSFTDGLLSISQYSEDSEASSVLFQLQVMFGYLKLSQKRYYDTLPFCKALIDYDGQPLSLTEQKDINEFAGMLFDKLEKNKAFADLLSRSIQGTLVWQTRSLETAYRSDREETFYMISAEVKDKGSLLESLELNVAEELFTGDNKIEDSESGRKVDAVRRCAIRSLPPTLIIHLKRFEFDLETMNRKKVNDYLSFPMELDMFPYTEEGIAAAKVSVLEDGLSGDDSSSTPSKPAATSSRPRQYYEYTLKGVVAHVGAIDRGHYYSFVKDRRTGQWFEFNDRAVLPFFPDNIPRECFGGTDEAGGAGGGTSLPRVRENNAYLLVYERRETGLSSGALSSLASPLAERLEAEGRAGLGFDSMPGSPSRPGKAAVTLPIAKRVEAAVWSENNDFQQDRFVYDRKHFLFHWKVLGLCEGALAASATELVASWILITLRFMIDVLARARAHSCVPLFLDKVEEVIVADSSACAARALITELASLPRPATPNAVAVHPWLTTVLQECPHGGFVRGVVRILAVTFKVILSQVASESPLPCVTRIQHPGGETDVFRRQAMESLAVFRTSRSFLSEPAVVVHSLLALLEGMTVDDALHKEGFKLGCSLLASIAALGFEEKYMLLRLGVIPRMVSAVLGMAPIYGRCPEAHFIPCIELVSGMVRGCAMPSTSLSEESAAVAKRQLTLFPEDLQAFLNRVFLEEAITLSAGDMSLALQHLCRSLPVKDAQRIVDFVAEKLVELASPAAGTSVTYRSYFRVLSDVLLRASPEMAAFQPVVARLAAKAQHLTQRNAPLDAEFVYSVCKLLHRVGMHSNDGNAIVLKVRDSWRDTASKFAALRSIGVARRQVPVPSTGSQHGAGKTGFQLSSLLG